VFHEDWPVLALLVKKQVQSWVIQDSSVSELTACGLDDWHILISCRGRILLLPSHPDLLRSFHLHSA
jgi:hypothetical protein